MPSGRAVDFETDDRTVVAGASTLVGLQRGDLLGERYDIRERLRDDIFTLDYRALDRSRNERVRVREVRPGLLGDTTAVQELLESLQEVVGIGGAFLPGLIDAAQEEQHVFVVEPWPSGMCLADVFDRRISQGRMLQAKELLPVVARLEAALSVVPEKWRHGDVRARQVWIDAGHLQLTGAFLLDAMPTGAVAMVLQTNPTLRPYFAPEVAEGWAADAADRYGVATLVWEGLLGEAPPTAGGAGAAVRRLGPLGDVLAQYLAPDPMDRPATLKPLLDALSKVAGRAPPRLDPSPFHPRLRTSGRRRRHDTIPVPPPNFDDRARRAPTFAEVPAELRGPEAAQRGARAEEDEWDAMPTRQFDRSTARTIAEPTDPGQRRAPGPMAGEESLEFDEVSGSDLIPVDDDAPELIEVEPEELELNENDLQLVQPHGPQGLPKKKIPLPEGIKGIPRARRREPDAPVTRPAKPAAPSVMVEAGMARGPVEALAPNWHSTRADATPVSGKGARIARARRRRPPPPAPNRSVWLVLLAFVAAAAILAGSLLVAQARRHRLEEQRREQIQKRIQLLKEQGGTTE